MGAQASITRKEMGPPLNMRLTENQGSDGPTKRLHLSAVSFCAISFTAKLVSNVRVASR